MSDKKPDSSEQLYQDIFINAPLGVYTLDRDGNITTFNPMMEKISGDKADQVVGLNVFRLKNYKKVGLDKYFREGLSGKPFETELLYTSELSGKKTYRHYRGVPIKGASRKKSASRLLLIVEDVTLRKDAEKKLEQSQKVEQFERQRLLSLINNMGEAVVATDENGKILIYNAAVLNLLDTNASLENKKLGDLLCLKDKDGKSVDLMKLAQSSVIGITSTEYRHFFTQDDSMNLYINVAPVKLGFQEKAQSGYIIILRDITREKSLEEERDEFISVVSHELRTPVAIAEGNISNAQFIAQQDETAKPVAAALKQAHAQVVFLSSMINDLSTLSRAERTDVKVDIEPINPAEIIKQTAQDYTDDAEKKGLVLTGTSAPNVKIINTSKLYLKEILQNFLVNAIKYTEKGHVILHARSDKDGNAVFSVADSGIGLSKADQKKIFDKFFRSEDYRTRETNGTGLGLYVTSKLAHRINASISLESELNKGSTFTITVPNLEARRRH